MCQGTLNSDVSSCEKLSVKTEIHLRKGMAILPQSSLLPVTLVCIGNSFILGSFNLVHVEEYLVFHPVEDQF